MRGRVPDIQFTHTWKVRNRSRGLTAASPAGARKDGTTPTSSSVVSAGKRLKSQTGVCEAVSERSAKQECGGG